jgi:hypothetical protein
MNDLNYPETTKHVIVHDEQNYTYLVVEPQNCLATGQPYMVVFNTKEEAKQEFPQAFPDPVVESYLSSIPPEPDLNINTINNTPSPDIIVE